jgi:hypothetical protein
VLLVELSLLAVGDLGVVQVVAQLSRAAVQLTRGKGRGVFD